MFLFIQILILARTLSATRLCHSDCNVIKFDIQKLCNDTQGTRETKKAVTIYKENLELASIASRVCHVVIKQCKVSNIAWAYHESTKTWEHIVSQSECKGMVETGKITISGSEYSCTEGVPRSGVDCPRPSLTQTKTTTRVECRAYRGTIYYNHERLIVSGVPPSIAKCNLDSGGCSLGSTTVQWDRAGPINKGSLLGDFVAYQRGSMFFIPELDTSVTCKKVRNVTYSCGHLTIWTDQRKGLVSGTWISDQDDTEDDDVNNGDIQQSRESKLLIAVKSELDAQLDNIRKEYIPWRSYNLTLMCKSARDYIATNNRDSVNELLNTIRLSRPNDLIEHKNGMFFCLHTCNIEDWEIRCDPKQCTEYLPISLASDNSTYKSYLDIKNNIIVNSSKIISCDNAKVIYIQEVNGTAVQVKSDGCVMKSGAYSDYESEVELSSKQRVRIVSQRDLYAPSISAALGIATGDIALDSNITKTTSSSGGVSLGFSDGIGLFGGQLAENILTVVCLVLVIILYIKSLGKFVIITILNMYGIRQRQ